MRCSAAANAPVPGPRQTLSFDRAWRFHLSDAIGADQPAFADASWRTLDLPHDWMIEGPVGSDPAAMDGPFDRKSPAGKGGGYLNGGIGWYRKTFTAPVASPGKDGRGRPAVRGRRVLSVHRRQVPRPAEGRHERRRPGCGHESFQRTQRKAFHGLALAVLKSHDDTTGTARQTDCLPPRPLSQSRPRKHDRFIDRPFALRW